MELKTLLNLTLDKLLALGYNEKQLDIWKIFTYAVKEKADVWTLTLKADLYLLDYIIRGYSVFRINKLLNVPSKHIFTVAYIWGITPLSDEISIDPTYIYESGLSKESFVKELMIYDVERKIAEICFDNILRFEELKEILHEFEN